MILKGSQRGGGKQLAAHLLKTEENEHVDVHELRGFASSDLTSAFQEAYAISKGTQAKQFLFSISLNPPRDAEVSIESFEAAIAKIEKKLHLDDQPRAIVFHEKEGRRHAHVVWSRIAVDEMKAINLPHFKLKLGDISRELYHEHGWEMPKGFKNSQDRDPNNFSHDEGQQAQRAGHDPKALKQLFKDCWMRSDSRQAFSQALEEQGFALARGDRRGHVAVDKNGEVYAIAKYAGLRTADVKQRLGDAKDLPSIDEAKTTMAERLRDSTQTREKELRARHRSELSSLMRRRYQIVKKQREERAELDQRQQARWDKESLARSQRHSKGVRGLWDRLTGKQSTITRRNEMETLQAFQRDRKEKDAFIFAQIEERQLLHKQIRDTRLAHLAQLQVHRRQEAKGPEQSPRRPQLWERFREFRDAGEQANRAPRGRSDYDLGR